MREAWEVEIAALEGSVNIPLGQIPARAGLDLDPDAKIVVLCHHGIRSQHVAAFLKSQRDFDDVHNLTGGIDAWSRVVDPALRRAYDAGQPCELPLWEAAEWGAAPGAEPGPHI